MDRCFLKGAVVGAMALGGVAGSSMVAAPILAQATAELSDQTAGVPLEREEMGTFIDEVIEAALSEANIPGAVFLMVKDGEVFYSRGYGFANLEQRIPVDPERTVFRVGSVSKTLTSAAVLHLAESGEVSLYEDVNRYVTQVQVPATYARPVTLFNLLTHTGGFDEELFGQHAWTREKWQPLGEYLAEHLPPQFIAPGEVIAYNDHGVSLAGLVVEEVTGTPFAQYVDENIFQPLGMTRSSFDVANLPDDIRRDLATAYRYEDGEYSPYSYDYINTFPAAGLVSSASDMGRFMIELLEVRRNAETHILSDSVVAAMLRRQFGHLPKLPGWTFGFVEERENQQSGLRKDGQATGFTSRMLLLPEHNIGYFASINLSIIGRGGSFNSASRFHRHLTSAILDRYFPADTTNPEWAAPTPPSDFDERASRFTGTYRTVVGSRHTLEKPIFFLHDQASVSDNGDGTLSLGFGRWAEIDEDATFQWADGGPYYRGFRADRADPAGRAAFYFIGAGAYERISWYGTESFTNWAMAFFGLVFLTGALVWTAAALLQLRRKEGGRVRAHPGGWAAAAVCALNILFMVGLMMFFYFTDFQDLFKGFPAKLTALLVLPEGSALMTLALPFFSVAAWRGGYGSVVGRVYFSLVALTALLFVPFLWYWNLLGFQY